MKPHRSPPVRSRRKATRREVARVYEILLRRQGHAGWWPGSSPFEIALGAILVQNTAWTNAAKALGVLRARRLLSFRALHRLSVDEIAPLVRSSGTYRVKARRVRAFLDFLALSFGGRIAAMGRSTPSALREALLGVPGIGPETADSIALYAAGQPLFVIDAYTRRVFSRLGFIRGDESYDALQRFFTDRLRAEAPLFNDYHAQIVRLAKDHCRTRPLCDNCPLEAGCAKRGVG
jgi:endonuclease-3 related protein